MKIRTLDGTKIIEINFISANLKMAVKAESLGHHHKSDQFFLRAEIAELASLMEDAE